MNDFIMIDNKFFDFNNGEQTLFYRIGTEGFTIYTYLLLIQDRDKRVRTTIKTLHRQFNNIPKMKDTRTFKKFLIGLRKNNFIFCDELNQLTKVNDGLIIEINNPKFDNGFSKINSDILIKELEHIKVNGFSIFCMLFKFHNTTFGDGINGYACCTEEYMSNVLDIGVTQIKEGLSLLKKRKLIHIKSQPPTIIINKYGEEENTYLPNLYVVRPKIEIDHKYYLPIKEE